MQRTISIAGVFYTAVLSVLALSACSAPDASKALTNPATQTDATIRKDYKGYNAQQAAIKALNDAGTHTVRSYSLSKAQCWLDVSLHEYSRNDRSAFPQEAFNESIKITDYLKNASGANPALQTPLVNQADKLRDDLWAKAEALKTHQGYKCAEQKIACAEVELAHAGNEHKQQGWRHAKPYVQIAEDLLSDATTAANNCKPPPPPPRIVPLPVEPAVPAPATVPVPVLVQPTKTIEKITLNASALFRFDKRNAADLLPQGKAQLDDLANKINTVYATVESIGLIGHTDRLGTDAYNDKLSLDRASTVKTYLQSKGVTANMSVAGRGKAEPVAQCPGGNAPTPLLTQCLQPNRRVEVVITGEKK
jgi:OmpA-OmpF porin, OOP family